MNIAIVGATGNVGRKTLEVLEKKELSIDNLYLVASSKSAGKKISFKDKEFEVFDLEYFDFSIHNYKLIDNLFLITRISLDKNLLHFLTTNSGEFWFVCL